MTNDYRSNNDHTCHSVGSVGVQAMSDDLVKRLRGRFELCNEAADRIEELEFVLRFIANINYGNGPDVTMEHQGWAKRALGEMGND
jgi:hypothetical protein